ncbi:dihydrodipicolinate synthase family protein [Nocardia sp. NPDC003963]
MNPLAGVVGALLTPFAEDGNPDHDLLEDEYDFLSGHCDAVSVLGAEVSEYRALTSSQRRELLVEAVHALRDRTRVLAGISAPTVAEAVELAEIAAAAGAEFGQLLLPQRTWGGTPGRHELLSYVQQVAQRSPLPLVLYHQPGLGADPAFDLIVEACAVDGVVALKDSSRDISRNLRAVAEIQDAGHAQYLGTVQPMLAILLSGGAGAMMPPPFTLVGAEIRDAVAAGDLARAGRAQSMIARLPAAWAGHGLLPLAKAAMRAIGRPLGAPAAPFDAPPAAVLDAIAEITQTWPDLPAVETNSGVTN